MNSFDFTDIKQHLEAIISHSNISDKISEIDTLVSTENICIDSETNKYLTEIEQLESYNRRSHLEKRYIHILTEKLKNAIKHKLKAANTIIVKINELDQLITDNYFSHEYDEYLTHIQSNYQQVRSQFVNLRTALYEYYDVV